LAAVAGIAIADSIDARSGRARVRVAALWIGLFFVPVNAIAFISCFATPDREEVSPAEARLSEWVRTNTSRDAIFIDDHDRVPLLVTGPRRYYWGTTAYAEQWGYPRAEMSRRYAAVQALYRNSTLDAAAAETLAGVVEPLYVVVRPEHAGSAVTRDLHRFAVVFSDPEIALVRVFLREE
jgi:hypothetical protein